MDQIRLAQTKDIPELVALGEEFALASQPVHGFGVSRVRIIEFVNVMLHDPAALVLVKTDQTRLVGVMAGILSKIFFSEDVAMQELVWYVKKGFQGMSMLKTFEQMAAARGANRVIVGNKPDYCDLSRSYIRRGYKLLENQYVKKLRD